MSAIAITEAMQGMTVKDLREQCRARGVSPAGGVEALRQRLTENMVDTNDLGRKAAGIDPGRHQDEDQTSKNNYQRPAGNQNLGNRITNRSSSRVLAPPGGVSQISFGGEETPARRSAQTVLDQMGLGNTDEMVAYAHSQQTPVRPFHAMPMSGGGGPDTSAAAAAYKTSMAQNLSQVAFGDHHLPSYSAQHPEQPDDYPTKGADKDMASMVMSIEYMLKPMMLKDLRTQCRYRNLSPAGGADQLRERLGEHMCNTGDMQIVSDDVAGGGVAAPTPASYMADNGNNNNYSRPSGMQNVGNFITDRPTSRVLAPPGGGSQIMFGDHSLPGQNRPPLAPAPYATNASPSPAPYATNMTPAAAPYTAHTPVRDMASFGHSTESVKSGSQSNNYTRPNGQQNVGNFITDRPSSRVMQPPGGRCQITFG